MPVSKSDANLSTYDWIINGGFEEADAGGLVFQEDSTAFVESGLKGWQPVNGSIIELWGPGIGPTASHTGDYHVELDAHDGSHGIEQAGMMLQPGAYILKWAHHARNFSDGRSTNDYQVKLLDGAGGEIFSKGYTNLADSWDELIHVFKITETEVSSSDDGFTLQFVMNDAVDNRGSLIDSIELLKVELESDKAASGSYFPEDIRIDPIVLQNPQSFGEITDDDIDPCDRQREDPALVVFYEDVVDDDYNIEDFDVELTAGTDGLVDVFQWSKVKGPDSGTLTDANKSNAIYSDPKVGGLYQFDVDLGGQSIRTSLLLPLAGADITDWLEAEAASMEPWARAHLRATEEANYSSKPFVTRYAVFRTWITISGAFFDYTLDSVDANELSPCRRYQSDISDEAEYGYLTVSGVVVHGSKINLALWSLFGNHWGYSQYELAAGGHLNQIMTRFSLDPVSSTEAIGLGSQMFLFPNTSMDSSGRINHLRRMQSNNDLIEEKLWPSPYPMDPSKSDMSRPDPELPTTPNPGSDQPPF